MMKTSALPLLFLLVTTAAPPVSQAADSSADALHFTQPEVRLWPNGPAPGSEGHTGAPRTWNPSKDGIHRVTNIHDPSLLVFLPPHEKANGLAFVVCPGGGHRYLTMDLEGSAVAERLNAMGIAAFVLQSRLAHAEGSPYQVEPHSLADAQRAIRVVRSRAQEWHVDPARVGIIGFSAGGELAALASVRPSTGDSQAADPIDRLSARPDFAVLAYPGIRSTVLAPTKDTPPTFLFVANDDPLAAASVDYLAKLRAAGTPVEAHFFNKGGHGFGANGRTPEFAHGTAAMWPDELQRWLQSLGALR